MSQQHLDLLDACRQMVAVLSGKSDALPEDALGVLYDSVLRLQPLMQQQNVHEPQGIEHPMLQDFLLRITSASRLIDPTAMAVALLCEGLRSLSSLHGHEVAEQTLRACWDATAESLAATRADVAAKGAQST